MPKKKTKNQLESLSQTHGKVERPLTLDQVWGDDGSRKYGTLNTEEYSKYLESLNKTDMQAHAIKIGLVPIDNRENLVKRLMTEFNKHVAQFTPRPETNNGKKLSKSARDILAEGR